MTEDVIKELAVISTEVGEPRFGAARVQHVVLAPPQRYFRPHPLLDESPDLVWPWLVKWHRAPCGLPPRGINCYFIENLTLVGHDTPLIDGATVVSVDAMPAYRARLVQGDHLPVVKRDLALPCRDIEGPCFPLAADGNVYGHFLIEALGRLHVVQRMLREDLPAFRILVVASLPDWVRTILTQTYGIPPDDIIEYDPQREHVRIRQAIWPALTMCGDMFHPFADYIMSDLLAWLRPTPTGGLERIFITRAFFHPRASAPKTFANDAEITDIAVHEYGFVPVAPECLPWFEQVRLFANARVVVGQFGSGLHNTLFSPRGAHVGALGFGNLVQSGISSLRRQHICYLTQGNEQVPFIASPDLFRRLVDSLLRDFH